MHGLVCVCVCIYIYICMLLSLYCCQGPFIVHSWVANRGVVVALALKLYLFIILTESVSAAEAAFIHSSRCYRCQCCCNCCCWCCCCCCCCWWCLCLCFVLYILLALFHLKNRIGGAVLCCVVLCLFLIFSCTRMYTLSKANHNWVKKTRKKNKQTTKTMKICKKNMYKYNSNNKPGRLDCIALYTQHSPTNAGYCWRKGSKEEMKLITMRKKKKRKVWEIKKRWLLYCSSSLSSSSSS